MNVVFVGAGDVASQYAEGLSQSPLTLEAVCDTDADRATALAREHDASVFTGVDEMLAATDAPIVVNLTSHGAHASITRAALAADRHVFSEKPLALDAATVESLLDTAADRDLALAAAPITPRCPSQRRAGRALVDGRLGTVRLGYAFAHVGRVTEWHDRPASFLEVGPLYDGAVYPLSALVSWFGPVERVRTADALDVWPEREPAQPSGAAHVEATLAFASGPVVRLTASFYAPHRSREFYGLELHGDDGSLYLADSGSLDVAADGVSFGRLGRDYTTMPPQTPERPCTHFDGVERFAAAIEAGRRPRGLARRGAHVVAICDAIERAAETGGSTAVEGFDVAADPVAAPTVRPPSEPPAAGTDWGLRLPPIGFGTSRYRDGEYVDRVDSIATALDAGYRLFDVAELYGNEHRIGDLLSAPGTPDRDGLFLFGKVWNTNHDHVIEACEGSLQELGVDAFDAYALHWPEAWAHQGPLRRLDERPVETQERLTFPEEESGAPATADLSLVESWRNLERVSDRGLTRTLGVCNVSLEQLRTILSAARVPPAVVQVERHPYRPRTDLVEFCHDRGIRVVAHSPLSAPGLLEEPVLREIGAEYDLSPAGVVIAWNVSQGVVPIPSSTEARHVIENLAAAGTRLSSTDMTRIDALRDPDFER